MQGGRKLWLHFCILTRDFFGQFFFFFFYINNPNPYKGENEPSNNNDPCTEIRSSQAGEFFNIFVREGRQGWS